MPLVIESEEAEELARELVRLTGETTADTVARALRERFERLHRGFRINDAGLSRSLSTRYFQQAQL
jgi:hypothetical protein